MTVAEATAERDRILNEVVAARPHTTEAGLDVIRAWAARGKPFSLNDCRAELHAVGVVGQYAPGGLVRRAIQMRIIRKVGVEQSSSRATHGKEIARYVAANRPTGLSSLIPTSGEVLAVPVQRDRGRFTRTASAPAPDALFDIEEGTT